MPANARHAGAEALEHIAVTLRFKRRTCWFELVGQELDMRIIFLQPRVVELTVDRRDARVTLFASQHAVDEHQYLGLPDREITALPAKPFLDVTEICSGRIGNHLAGTLADALSSPDRQN